MNVLETVKSRQVEIETELESIRTKRSALADKAVEKRDMSTEELTEYNSLTDRRSALKAELPIVTERVQELEERATSEQAASAARVVNAAAEVANTGGAKVVEAPLYRKDNNTEASYFKDLYYATRRSDSEAADRLRRNASIEHDIQLRAGLTVGDTVAGTPGAAGVSGPFAPPAWLINEYVRLARPARVTSNTFDKMALPSGIATLNIPRVTQGTAVSNQTAELAQLTQQQVKTDYVSSGISPIGGLQLISLQLLEQSAIPFDRVVLEDLSRSFAAFLNDQSINGNGTAPNLRGLGAAAGLDITSATIDATQAMSFSGGPAATGAAKTTNFYSAILLASAAIHKVRFLPADTIVMHPSRWAWVVAQADSQKRPLVVPEANGPFNAVSSDADYNVAQGRAGRLAGMDVFVDAQLPVNGGSGNQAAVNAGDVVYVYLRNDIKLWESTPRIEAFESTYADQAAVLFRMFGYAAMIPDRFGSSIVQIRNVGTPGAGTANGLGTITF